MTNLFQRGKFVLHSGGTSQFKIDCDALTDEDWETIAAMIAKRIAFQRVIGLAAGGLKLSKALAHYAIYSSDLPLLIVDDVLTTGQGIEECKSFFTDYQVMGVVLFARGRCPNWITPIFQLNQIFEEASDD